MSIRNFYITYLAQLIFLLDIAVLDNVFQASVPRHDIILLLFEPYLTPSQLPLAAGL